MNNFNGTNNKSSQSYYSQFTVMKPLAVRSAMLSEPQQIVETLDRSNYINYRWNSPQEKFTAINAVTLGAFLAFLGVAAFFILRQKVLKFAAFFVTEKHYLRLKLNLKTSIIDKNINPSASKPKTLIKARQSTDRLYSSPKQIEANIITKSPLKVNAEYVAFSTVQKIEEQPDLSLRNRFLVNLSPIINFYIPIFAILQPLIKEKPQIGQNKQLGTFTTFKTIKLPYAIVTAQFLFRIMLLLTTSVMFSILIANSECKFSREKHNYSYFCLNLYLKTDKQSIWKLFLGGVLTSLIITPVCYKISSIIFVNFVEYVKKFIDHEKQDEQQEKIAKWREQRSVSNQKQKLQSSKKKSSAKKQFAEPSYEVSQFNLLGVESKINEDQSQRNIFAYIDESSYLSSNAGDRSVSTGLNYTERGLIQSNLSDRSLIVTPKGHQSKLFPLQADNNLLPIDEDDNDEKCSPIKPKIRQAQFSNSSIFEIEKEQSVGSGLGKSSNMQLQIFKQGSKESGYESLDIPKSLIIVNQCHSSPEKLENQNNEDVLQINNPQVAQFDISGDNQSCQLKQFRNALGVRVNSIDGLSDFNNANEGLLTIFGQDKIQNNIKIRQNSAQQIRFVESRDESTVSGHAPALNSVERNDYSLSYKNDNQKQTADAINPIQQNIPQTFSKIRYFFKQVLPMALGCLYLVFSIAMTAYIFVNFTKEGLYFSLLTFLAALVVDVATQFLIAVGMTIQQLNCELKGTKLPLECIPLMQLSEERCELVFEVFNKYYPTDNVLVQLPVECNTEELVDIEIDIENGKKLMQNLRSAESMKESLQFKKEINLNSAEKKNQTYLYEADKKPCQQIRKIVLCVAARGIEVEVEELMTFTAPTCHKQKSEQTYQVNVVSPKGFPEDSHNNGQMAMEVQGLKKKRKKDIIPQNVFVMKEFANSKTKKLRKIILQKEKEDDILDSEFDDSEEQKSNGRLGSKNPSQTPQGSATKSGYKSNFKFSSNKKIQNYETPNLQKDDYQISQKKAQGAKSGILSSGGESESKDQRFDVPNIQRFLIAERQSQPILDDSSLENSRKISSIKQLIKGDVGSVVSDSIKPTTEISHIIKDNKTPRNGQDSYRQSLKDVNLEKEKNMILSKEQKEKYSPMWSSVDQKKKVQKADDETVTNFDHDKKRQSILQQNSDGMHQQIEVLDSLKTNRTKEHRIGVHQNFNSPRSLRQQVSNLTSDRLGGPSETGKNTHRKLMMQDDAEIDNSSIKFGSGNGIKNQLNSSLVQSIQSVEGIKKPDMMLNTSIKMFSRKNAREKMNQILNEVQSQVNFDDQGETTIQNFAKASLDFDEMENDVFLEKTDPILVQGYEKYIDDNFDSNIKVRAEFFDQQENNQTFSGQTQGVSQNVDRDSRLKVLPNSNPFQRLILASTEVLVEEITPTEKIGQSLVKIQAKPLAADQRSHSQARPQIKPIGVSPAIKHTKPDLINESRLFRIPENYQNDRCISVPLEQDIKKQQEKDLKTQIEIISSMKFLIEPKKRFNKLSSECQQIQETQEEQDCTPYPPVRRAQTILENKLQEVKYKPIQRKLQIISSPKNSSPSINLANQTLDQDKIQTKNDYAMSIMKGALKERKASNQTVVHNREEKKDRQGPRFRNSSLGTQNEVQAHPFKINVVDTQRKASHSSNKSGTVINGLSNSVFLGNRASNQGSGNDSSLDTRNAAVDMGTELKKLSSVDKSLDKYKQHNLEIRIQDQKRRLESFLLLAKQAQAKKDIFRIKDMIKQIDETQKPLPMSRINDLKLLELMTSPYNQQLISMIKVEVELLKKIKEQKKKEKQEKHVQLIIEAQKQKFMLPKHKEDRAMKWQRLQQEEADKHFKVLEKSYGANPFPSSATGIEKKEPDCDNCRDLSSGSRKNCEGRDCSKTENYYERPKAEYIQNLVNSKRAGNKSQSNSSMSQIAASIQNLGSSRSREAGLRDSSYNRSYFQQVGVAVTTGTENSRKSVDRIRNEQIYNRMNPMMSELRTSFEMNLNAKNDFQRLPKSVLNSSKPVLFINSDESQKLNSMFTNDGNNQQLKSTSSFIIANGAGNQEANQISKENILDPTYYQ